MEPDFAEENAALRERIRELETLLTLADKAIYSVVDGGIPLVCDACAVKYHAARHAK